MIDRTVVTYLSAGMEYDVSEMMDSKPSANLAARWNGYASGYFYEALDEVSERLGGNTVSMTPIEKTINGKCLESWRQKTRYE
jgi:hypothetical protein